VAWIKQFNSVFSKLVARQLMAVIQRDQRSALDDVGGAGALASFVGYYFGGVPIKQFPAVALAPLRIAFDREAVGSLSEQLTIAVAIAVQHQDPQAAAETLEDYMRAIDELLNSMLLSDFSAALTLTHPMFSGGSIALTGLPATTRVTDLFIESHDYGEIRRLRTGFATTGVIALLLDVEESHV
jgi:hypothetical protein